MIKSLIILILLVALLGVAAITRPGPESFKTYAEKNIRPAAGNVIDRVWKDVQFNDFMKSVTFQNRILWIDVQKDGQTIYTGAFGKWFDRNKPIKEQAQPAAG